AQAMMGIPSTGTNPIYRQFIENLFEDGEGPIVVRIGGNSTDSIDSNGQPNSAEISAFSQLHKDTAAQFYLSVNLGTADAKLAAEQAKFFTEHMPPGSLKAI